MAVAPRWELGNLLIRSVRGFASDLRGRLCPQLSPRPRDIRAVREVTVAPGRCISSTPGHKLSEAFRSIRPIPYPPPRALNERSHERLSGWGFVTVPFHQALCDLFGLHVIIFAQLFVIGPMFAQTPWAGHRDEARACPGNGPRCGRAATGGTRARRRAATSAVKMGHTNGPGPQSKPGPMAPVRHGQAFSRKYLSWLLSQGRLWKINLAFRQIAGVPVRSLQRETAMACLRVGRITVTAAQFSNRPWRLEATPGTPPAGQTQRLRRDLPFRMAANQPATDAGRTGFLTLRRGQRPSVTRPVPPGENGSTRNTGPPVVS